MQKEVKVLRDNKVFQDLLDKVDPLVKRVIVVEQGRLVSQVHLELRVQLGLKVCREDAGTKDQGETLAQLEARELGDRAVAQETEAKQDHLGHLGQRDQLDRLVLRENVDKLVHLVYKDLVVLPDLLEVRASVVKMDLVD